MAAGGNIEYLGRIDHQVKIRGYRIELGEIEAGLLQVEPIREAVVMARENEQGQNELCAYVVAEGELTIAQLRGELAQTLPSYMIPAYFVQLEKLPLTPNGKIDRRALPAPDGKLSTGVAYVAPRSETEQALAEIWQELLGAAQVGAQDNFFDLGGHSLRAMTLVSRIHQQFEVEVSLRDVFGHPTLEGLAAVIGAQEKSAYAAIPQAKEQSHYPVSSAQKRMYVLSQMEGAGTSYNMPAVLQLEGKLDQERLSEAMNGLIARHESLRTSFELVEGEVVQIVHPDVAFTISQKRCSEAEAKQQVEAFIRPFDLTQAPLLRVEVLQVAEEKHLLLLDMPHIISDGVSMGVLVEEFTQLYAGESLPALRIQYKDYAVWEQERQGSEAMREHEAYWLERFTGELPVLQLPTDYPRPAVQQFEGDRVSFTLDREQTAGLRRLAEETETTLYMVLLAAYKTLMFRYTGQGDLIVGTPVAGRGHADLERVMGMFVNTLALRSYPSGEKTFVSFLQEVKEQLLESFQHQEYPFEMLVEQLALTRDASRNPLFDTMFVLQNTEMGSLELPGLRIAPYEAENRIAKFDLTLEAMEAETEIQFSLEYRTSLFKEETIKGMIGHFLKLIEGVIREPEARIAELELLKEEEKQQILYDFNATAAEYPREQMIHELFEEQVERTPDHIAVVFGDQELSYRELNARANQLARVLREKGVAADSLVGIMMERSPRIVVGMLAILKAGGAYVPIDPEYPQERIQYVLQDSGAALLLTDKQQEDRFRGRGSGD